MSEQKYALFYRNASGELIVLQGTKAEINEQLEAEIQQGFTIIEDLVDVDYLIFELREDKLLNSPDMRLRPTLVLR